MLLVPVTDTVYTHVWFGIVSLGWKTGPGVRVGLAIGPTLTALVSGGVGQENWINSDKH